MYDKPYINDNNLEYSYLHDPANYRLLGRKRPFFIKPFYAKRTDFCEKVSGRIWALRIFGSLILLKLGYEFGVWDGAYFNEKLAKSKVVEMETEEEIYDYLYNKDKTAVFIQLYNPGHFLSELFNRAFEIESAREEYDDVVFMRVHCRKHLNFCINKMWPDRILPGAEAYFINEKDTIEIADFNNKHRSGPGIAAFLEDNGIVEARLNPEKILERTATKYLQIL